MNNKNTKNPQESQVPLVKDQNVPSEVSGSKPSKYMCNDLKEKHVAHTHSYNLRSKAKLQLQLQQQQQQQQLVDQNNNEIVNGGAVKRCFDYVDAVDGETEDDQAAFPSSSSNMCSGRKSPAKKAKFLVTYKEMNDFFNLLKDQSISEFLKRDACCLISDKYALAMVFTYFKRAKFTSDEFTAFNFYLALYLASDIEEDVDEYKYEIFPWALGAKWRTKFSSFLRKRDALLKRIGYRAIVSRKCCEEVMSFISDHYAWKRERSEDHGGATRAYLITRGRRFLSSKSNLEEEELNLPRGPHEKPRPCPLCFVNKMNMNISKYISPATPSIKYLNQSVFYNNSQPLLLNRTALTASETSTLSVDTSETSGYSSNMTDTISSDSSFYSNTTMDSTLASSKKDVTIRPREAFLESSLVKTLTDASNAKKPKTPRKLKDQNNNDFNFANQNQKILVQDQNNNNVYISTLVDLNSQMPATKQNLKFPSVASANYYEVAPSDEEEEEEDDDEDEDEEDEDEVFANGSEKTIHIKTGNQTSRRLNQRRSLHHHHHHHYHKYANNNNNAAAGGALSKKKLNFSLSANTTFSSECSFNTSSLSSSTVNLTHIQFNDQLVPRDSILIAKNLI